MKKYYIEFVWHRSTEGYLVQSRWFDTEKEALDWCKTVDFVHETIDVYLMGAIWDEKGTYGDIFMERRLNI